MKPLTRSFFDRDTAVVAQELLGKPFICKLNETPIYGRIVETEAYQSDDEACHAYKGISKRNAALFGPVGHTYVYLCYGIHYCLNIVSRNTANLPAGGVLIRGILQLDSEKNSSQGVSDTHRIDGPGRTAKALSITTQHIGIDVTDTSSQLVVYDGSAVAATQVAITPRIGLSKGTNKLWRYVYTP